MIELQEKIRQTRQKLKLTQKEVAEKLDISQSAYNQMENSNSDKMQVGTLRKLCLIFNVSADWLLNLDSASQSEEKPI